jgi:hypothetical protein
MPELGINLISQGELNKDTYTILTYNSVLIKQGNKIITKGDKLQNLYYLPIKVINNKDQILKTTNINNIISDNNVISANNTNTNENNTNNNINNLTWHLRLGHINNEVIKKLNDSTLGYNNIYTNNINTNDINKS